MSMETLTEASSIADHTPDENGLEAWTMLVRRFDPASAHANLNLMSEALKAPKGKIEYTSFLMEMRDEIVRSQDHRTGSRRKHRCRVCSGHGEPRSLRG